MEQHKQLTQLAHNRLFLLLAISLFASFLFSSCNAQDQKFDEAKISKELVELFLERGGYNKGNKTTYLIKDTLNNTLKSFLNNTKKGYLPGALRVQKDLVTDFFSNEQIDYYLEHLKNNKFLFIDDSFDNKNIIVKDSYINQVKPDNKDYISIGKPIFTEGSTYAIICSTTSKGSIINIFRNIDNKWSFHRSFIL